VHDIKAVRILVMDDQEASVRMRGDLLNVLPELMPLPHERSRLTACSCLHSGHPAFTCWQPEVGVFTVPR